MHQVRRDPPELLTIFRLLKFTAQGKCGSFERHEQLRSSYRPSAFVVTMLEIEVLHADGFVHLTLKGAIDSVNQSEPFVRAAAECRAHGCKAALIDGRKATRNVSTVDLYDLGSRLHELGMQGLKVAMVNESYDFGITTKFLETVARNRGQNLRAFDQLEAAVAWLKEPSA